MPRSLHISPRAGYLLRPDARSKRVEYDDSGVNMLSQSSRLAQGISMAHMFPVTVKTE
jgi:hypothetical protein